MTLASIMMVTYNRLELTKQTLNDLFETTDYPFNLVLIDNDSKDGTVEYLKTFCEEKLLAKHSFFMGYKLQANTENKGIAIGRNQALALADGDWLVTFDNDVKVPKGWLSEAIDIMTKVPIYGMIGVNMENTPYSLVSIAGKEFQRKPQGNLGTACIVFNKNFHKMLGFFNTEYGLYGEEDADMGMRARVVGYQLGYIKESGKHLGEGENDVGEYREFKTESHRRNLAKFNENCRLYATGKKPIYIPFKQ